VKKPQKWDQKWRVVVFEASEGHGPVPRKLKRELSDFGFVAVKEDVYLHPYDFFSEAEDAVERCGMESFVEYVLAEDIEEVKELLLRLNRGRRI